MSKSVILVSASDRVSEKSPLEKLAVLIPRYGVRCSVEEFQASVNLIFHDIEAEVYDEVHQDMWESLPRQFELLASDILKLSPMKPLRVLDIGCGTGLSSELLLRSQIGSSISNLHLIDTSPKMLERAEQRLLRYPVELQSSNGLISELTDSSSFDLILTCSVLHHIPDLSDFLRDVKRLNRPGGFFLHLQDPNADSERSTERRQRAETYHRIQKPLIPKSMRRMMPDRLIPAIWRRLTGSQAKSYLDRVNDRLLKEGIVSKPMSSRDIWTVTDIRIFSGDGISIDEIAKLLPGYSNVSTRSYGFYSVLASSLPSKLRAKEESLIDSGSLEGSYIEAVWRRDDCSN